MLQKNEFNILAVDSSPDVLKSVSFALETEFGAELFEAKDANGAIQFLNMMDNIHVILVGAIEHHPELLGTLTKLNPKIKMIIGCESNHRDSTLSLHPGFLGFISRADLLKGSIELIKDKFFSGDVLKGSEKEFSRIRGRLISHLKNFPCDIFIRLNESKFLKIFPKADPIQLEAIQKYSNEKKVEYFWVKTIDNKLLIEAIQNHFSTIADSSKNIEPEMVEKIVSDLAETSQQIIHAMGGVTEEVKQMTQATLKMTIKSLGKTPTTAQVLKRFQLEPGKYISQHSLILGDVACLMATKLGWQSEQTFQKLILAAMFHDISLKSHEVAKCQTLEEYQTNKELILLDNIDAYKMHPIHSADIVNQLGNIPPDVDIIIRQHHERPDGTGFPKKESHTTINPLSALFIIAHDYLVTTLNKPLQERPISPLEFIAQKNSYYSIGIFKRLLKQLEEGFKKPESGN